MPVSLNLDNMPHWKTNKSNKTRRLLNQWWHSSLSDYAYAPGLYERYNTMQISNHRWQWADQINVRHVWQMGMNHDIYRLLLDYTIYLIVKYIHRSSVDSLHKGPIMWKAFPCHDVALIYYLICTWTAHSHVVPNIISITLRSFLSATSAIETVQHCLKHSVVDTFYRRPCPIDWVNMSLGPILPNRLWENSHAI